MVSTTHEHTRQTFSILDELVLEHNRAKQLPSTGTRFPRPDVGGQLMILQRGLRRKKTRRLPIRQLIGEPEA